MWEAVKTRMSGRAVWEWAAVLIFVGALATFVVYATNPDGTLVIQAIGNGDSHVWGVGETVEYEALCSFGCSEYCNAGFTQDAGLGTSSNFNNDNYATASGIKSETGSGTLSAECPMYGGHGEPTQVFTVVDIDYIDVADTRAEAAGTMVCCYPKEATGYIYLAATLTTPDIENSDLRTGFLNWTKTDGTLNFTKIDERNVKVPKTATGYITLTAQAGDEASVWTITIWVLETNLIAIGIDEEDEENPGLFVGVNQYGYFRPNVSPYDLPDTHDVTITWDPELNDKFEIWNEWTSKRVNYNSNNSWDPDEIQNVVMAPPLRFDGLEASSNVRDIELYLQYWDPNYIIHSDTVNVTVVEVDLDAVGTSDADEATVGAFVIVNDDDDDEDGTSDNEDTDGVTEENDLVALTLQQIKPTDLPGTDYATISWSNSTINVFENADRTDAVTSGDTYLLSVLPKTLHVEGNSTGFSTVELEYCVGTATVSDSVIFMVGTLGMYRDSDCTNVLNDWPKNGTAIRSPKYIFGEEDDIFVKVTGCSGKADNYYDIEVENLGQTGESVNLDMIETSSGIYKNTGTGDALRLSTASTPSGTAEYIKVVDEEILSFIVQVNGVNIGEKSVMVDRAEFAATAIEEYDDNALEFYDEMRESRVNWFSAGYEIFDNDMYDPPGVPPMRPFLQNGGASYAYSAESDFMYTSSHGGPTGRLYEGNPDKDVVLDPATQMDTGQDWNMDINWVWIHSCYNLNELGQGKDNWGAALFGNPRPSHMVLGYHNQPTGDITGEIDDFFDHAAGTTPETIVSSYYHANTDWPSDLPCAIIEHQANDGDYLTNTTRDTSSTTMRYYWYDVGENDWIYSDSASAGEGLADDEARAQSAPSVPVDLAPIMVELLPPPNPPVDLTHFRRAHGLDVFSKQIPHQVIVAQDKDTAVTKALSVIGEVFGGLPDDAGTVVMGTFYAQDYEWDNPPAEQGGIPIGREVKYRHYYKGIPILGDLLAVGVFGDELTGMRSCWHRVIAEEEGAKKPVVSFDDAKRVAAQAVAARHDTNDPESVELIDSRIVYYGFHNSADARKRFIPAWKFTFRSQEPARGVFCEYVDAHINVSIPAMQQMSDAMKKVVKSR